MGTDPLEKLSSRERQIMGIVYRQGEVTAKEVRAAMPDPPGYSSVRTLLTILEEKGHLTHRVDGPRYVYKPTRSRRHVRRSALHHLVNNFFDGSREKTMAALLDSGAGKIPEQELDNLAELIEKARRRGR